MLAATAMFGGAAATHADEDQVARGKYLVTIGGCNDCHTPGALLGKPDFSRALSGSEVGFSIPGLGVFAGRNLTQDKETGLGAWTDDQIISAMTAGSARMAGGLRRSCPGKRSPTSRLTTPTRSSLT